MHPTRSIPAASAGARSERGEGGPGGPGLLSEVQVADISERQARALRDPLASAGRPNRRMYRTWRPEDSGHRPTVRETTLPERQEQRKHDRVLRLEV